MNTAKFPISLQLVQAQNDKRLKLRRELDISDREIFEAGLEVLSIELPIKAPQAEE